MWFTPNLPTLLTVSASPSKDARRESNSELPFTRTTSRGSEWARYKANIFAKRDAIHHRTASSWPAATPPLSLSRPLSPDAFYCFFSSREDCPGPRLELGGTIFTIHAFRRGLLFPYLSLSVSLSHAHTHTHIHTSAGTLNLRTFLVATSFIADVKAEPRFRRAIEMTRKRQNGSQSDGTRERTCWPRHAATRRDAISRPPHDTLPNWLSLCRIDGLLMSPRWRAEHARLRPAAAKRYLFPWNCGERGPRSA